MKKFALAGMAAIVGLVTMVGAAMAHHADVDALMMNLQPEVSIYELSLLPDGADLLKTADVLVEVDVVPDGLTGATIATVQATSLTEPLATRGVASSTIVDDAMRLWRTRTVDVFTVAPDLLI